MTDKLLTSKEHNIEIKLTDDKQAFVRYINTANFIPYHEFYTSTTDKNLKGFLDNIISLYISSRDKE